MSAVGAAGRFQNPNTKSTSSVTIDTDACQAWQKLLPGSTADPANSSSSGLWMGASTALEGQRCQPWTLPAGSASRLLNLLAASTACYCLLVASTTDATVVEAPPGSTIDAAIQHT